MLAVSYAVVGVAGGWAVTRAEKRRRWQCRISGAVVTQWNRLALLQRHTASQTCLALAFLRAAAQSAFRVIRRRPGISTAALVLLSLPALLALLFSPRTDLGGYPDAPAAHDPVVATLLIGEQLVPPSPLPPDLFLAGDLDLIRPGIASASRDWALLDNEFRQRLLGVFRSMAKHGYQMALLEGYRSPERQAILARLGPQVTNAGAYQSYHQYGLAADSAFFRSGKIVISERDAWAMKGYQLYGEYAESAGLVWGGRWRMMDFGHVELRKPRVLPYLQ
ncbi:M15 family metallopeptidase [Noviherbaspirillum sp. UKPF54]|nr:M15 family metallopeptidase [Noviherbaspirillum sp. UKPF54]